MASVYLIPAISSTSLVRHLTEEEAAAYIAQCPPEVQEWLRLDITDG